MLCAKKIYFLAKFTVIDATSLNFFAYHKKVSIRNDTC